MSIRVLLVADETADQAVICLLLRARAERLRDVDVHLADTWEAAKVRIVLQPWDVIVMNHRVGDADAAYMLKALRDLLPHRPVIVLTPLGQLRTMVRMLRAGADETIMKDKDDWDVELRAAIERLAAAEQRHSLRGEHVEMEAYATRLASVMARQRAPWAARLFGLSRLPPDGAPVPGGGRIALPIAPPVRGGGRSLR